MAIITGVVGLLARFAGQVLNTTLGWATLLLFGKVPQQRQTLLLVIVFGSLVWVALVLGVIFPQVGTLLIAAMPLPAFIDPTWVRLAMLAGALILPLLIGVAAVLVTGEEKSSRPAALVGAVLRGYPFALVLALMLVLLALIGTVRKLRSLTKRWEDAHVPVIVKPGGYDAVLEDVRCTLDAAGLDLEPRDAGALLSGPPKLLNMIAGRALGELVPDRLQILGSPRLEILVYPSDLAISGTRDLVARARAALASHVSEAPAYLTTSAEAQHVEDELGPLLRGAETRPLNETLAALRPIDDELSHLTVPFDEWQILYRLRLQVERDARRAWAPQPMADTTGRQPSRLEMAIGLGGIGLVILDFVMLLVDRLRPAPRG